MTPEFIVDAIAKVGGTIQSCTPVCEGSRHFLVLFGAPPSVERVEGAASFERFSSGTCRADFILSGN